MKIHFGQIYTQAGVNFPFSIAFQHLLSSRVSDCTTESTYFRNKYGNDWNLIFRISAKKDIKETEIRGPSRYPKEKDVEYTIFLPFDTIQDSSEPTREAILKIMKATERVLTRLEFETSKITELRNEVVDEIMANPKMIKNKAEQNSAHNSGSCAS